MAGRSRSSIGEGRARRAPWRNLVPLGVALSSWTLFAWTNRVRNVLDDESLVGWSRQWRLGVAVGFCVVALIGLGLLAWERRRAVSPLTKRFFALFALLGIGWWGVRGVSTLFGEFSIGFKIVHSVLALVTIGLGVLVLRVAKLSDRYG